MSPPGLCNCSQTHLRLYFPAEERKSGLLHAWQEAKSNLFITASSHMQSLRWGTISSRADLSSGPRCYPLIYGADERIGQGETQGVDLSRLSFHCPPVSAIQPNEVIIEPDTNTHGAPFIVAFHHFESATNQGRTPLSDTF